ncbi:MAG: gamma-glutamyl-gamma-aminobutyrate hydrolase family protein [Thermoflexales bacterium]
MPRILVPIPAKSDLKESYRHSLESCGAALQLLRAELIPLDVLREALDACDGVMLTGGGDVNPKRYSEDYIHPEVYGVDEDRDHVEIELAKLAVAADKPLFAICRGVQVLNVALGGTLHQHLPELTPIEHRGHNRPRQEPAHEVQIEPGTRLAQIIGTDRAEVNSFHHQAIDTVAHGLCVAARAPDGLVEAVEMPHKRFVLGVQWHPEDMFDSSPPMRCLFEAFVKACAGERL